MLTDNNEVVPTPLGQTIHASKPNELIHFEYCYINKGIGNFEYVLIIKEDFSGYTWFVLAESPDVETNKINL